MQLHLSNPDLEAKIDRWVAETGRPADNLAEEAIAGYLDELGKVREMLDSRYDDLESGRVQLVDGEEVYARLMQRTKAQRSRTA